MPRLIESPSIIAAAGDNPKKIEEFIGRVNSETSEISIARMTSPGGWSEPGQTPEFAEYTVVLAGQLQVETQNGVITVQPGQAVIVSAGEWVRYSTPAAEGAQYVAVCLPGFSPDIVHRDPE